MLLSIPLHKVHLKHPSIVNGEKIVLDGNGVVIAKGSTVCYHGNKSDSIFLEKTLCHGLSNMFVSSLRVCVS